MFKKENVVCPPALRRGIFTVAALDNFDHNPSSTSAKTSLHGTSISMFQELTERCPGTERNPIILSAETKGSATIQPIPEHYAIVPAAALSRSQPSIPQVNGAGRSGGEFLVDATQDEYRYDSLILRSATCTQLM